jgi:hypothetical protein
VGAGGPAAAAESPCRGVEFAVAGPANEEHCR